MAPNETPALAIGPALGRQLDVVREAGLPALLVGPHGIGKSEFLIGYARARGLAAHVLDLSLLEATDLTGLPYLEGGQTRFAPPATLPRAGSREPCMLVLEELNRCDRSVRQPCLQLLTARHLNGYTLPEGCFVAACINPVEAGGYEVDELDPALASRFYTMKVAPHIPSWLEWGRAAGVEAAVLRLVEKFPQSFDKAPPRTWAYASRVLAAARRQGWTEDELEGALTPLLPSLAARALVMEIAEAMPAISAAEMLADPAAFAAKLGGWVAERRLDLVTSALDRLGRERTARPRDPVLRAAIATIAARAPADLAAPLLARLRRPKAQADLASLCVPG
jgi:MoxR-like ATPase